jgi:hypothetical protein
MANDRNPIRDDEDLDQTEEDLVGQVEDDDFDEIDEMEDDEEDLDA